MRGAPQVGFSETIRKIKARTSLLTRFRPPTWRTLETHVQYKRNPARCQFTTVLGVTKTRGFLHPDQNVLNATQNSLCRAVNRRRGRCACRASNCRRRARFSRTRSSRERKTLTNQPRKCRSDTIMARILAEKSESSLAPSHSFCRCTTFWRGTGHPREANLPYTLNVHVRNPRRSNPKEASGKHECVAIQYQIPLECQPTYCQEQPEQDRNEAERKTKRIRAATAQKRHHSYPCNSSAEGQDEQPQFGVVRISPW